MPGRELMSYPDGMRGDSLTCFPSPAHGVATPAPVAPVPPPPSKTTGIAAVFLATTTGLLAAAGAAFSAYIVADAIGTSRGPSHPDDLPDFTGFIIIVFFGLTVMASVIALTQLLGAALLFARRTAGRVLVIISSAAALPANYFAFGTDLHIRELNDVARFAGFSLCIATVILAALPSTGRWIAAPKLQQFPYLAQGTHRRPVTR